MSYFHSSRGGFTHASPSASCISIYDIPLPSTRIPILDKNDKIKIINVQPVDECSLPENVEYVGLFNFLSFTPALSHNSL